MSFAPDPAVRAAIADPHCAHRLALLAAAVSLTACVSTKLDEPVQRTLVIAPRTVQIRAGLVVDFTVTATNVTDPSAFTCSLNSTAVGTVSKTAAGCRLVVATPAVPGLLVARLETLADTASLVIVESGAAHRAVP
jgi:hypothetical protein